MRVTERMVVLASLLLSACGGSERVENEDRESGSGGEAASIDESTDEAVRASDPIPAPPPPWTARVVEAAAGSDVVIEGPCPTGQCTLAPVPLGPGTIRPLGMLDLAGDP